MKDETKGFLVVIVICMIVALTGHALSYFSGYLTERDYTATIVHKLMTPGTYKSSGRPIVILQLDDGYKFEHVTNYVIYMDIQEGQRLIWKMRPMDVKQTAFDNIWFFFMPVLLTCTGWVFGIGLAILFLFFSKKE
jgi:hypothetical protein